MEPLRWDLVAPVASLEIALLAEMRAGLGIRLEGAREQREQGLEDSTVQLEWIETVEPLRTKLPTEKLIQP